MFTSHNNTLLKHNSITFKTQHLMDPIRRTQAVHEYNCPPQLDTICTNTVTQPAHAHTHSHVPQTFLHPRYELTAAPAGTLVPPVPPAAVACWRCCCCWLCGTTICSTNSSSAALTSAGASSCGQCPALMRQALSPGHSASSWLARPPASFSGSSTPCMTAVGPLHRLLMR